MASARLVAISYWLPDKKLTNDDINQEHPEWSAEKISGKTGIFQRRIADDISVSDMAVNASLRLFEEYNIDKSIIDFILLCTQSPDYFLPTTACIVQNKLDLSTSAGALDFNLGCSGYIYGLGLAKGLIESGSAKNVLLITSETYTRFIHPEDKSNKTIFGDAAAATLVSSELNGLEIKKFVYGTDGAGAENLIVRNGGVKNRYTKSADIRNEENEFLRNDAYLYMNGQELFKFTAANVPSLVQNVLKKNEINDAEIDLYIFHQANKYMLEFVRKKIGIEKDKFFYFLEDCGNTVSSTIPIAYYEALKQNKINENSVVLLAGFGVGYSWAGCVLGDIKNNLTTKPKSS
jgi:3-oxoacyl-[acyl-carrier-protein] synthase-3